MSEFSRETLLNIIETDHVQCGEASALARMALAAMDSDPAATAEPISFDDWSRKCALQVTLCYSDFREKAQYIWDSARETQQPAPEHPEVLPCSVLLEPGLRFGKGIKTSTMLAALARRAVYESDMAALSPEERAEFQAGIEDLKSFIAQPAPVVMAEAKSRAAFEQWCTVNIERNKWHPEFYAHLPVREQWAAWEACRAAMLDRQLVDHVDEELLITIKTASALDSLPKTGEVQNTNSPVVPDCSAVAALTGIPMIPDGYVIVPKVATEKMLIAGLEEADPLGSLIDWNASRGDCNTREQVQGMFEAMLAAAQQEVK